MRHRKLKPLSARETERRQLQRVQAFPGRWGDYHEAKRQSGLGRSSIALLIKEKKIRSSKIGKRRLIDIPSLLDYIDARAVGPPAAAAEELAQEGTQLK